MTEKGVDAVDTLGSLVDKLATVNNKLFVTQELIYDIRRMTFSEFIDRFAGKTGLREIYDCLHRLSDLNVQRTALVNEVDATAIALVKAGVRGEELDNGANLQRAHKTIENS